MSVYSEMWNEICFLLSENINPSFSEKDFENQVVRAIEVLGWREFKNEIERQPTVQLGREGTLRPDLIIYNNQKKALIVVEVKRPSEDITRDYVIGQLRSYMRQMKSDFGLLIGSDLRVYYDGSLNPHADPLLLEKIFFSRDSKEGGDFVKLFNKDSLLNKEYNEYLNQKLHNINKKREINVLIDQLLSFETKQKIIGFLRNEVPDIGDEVFSEAIQQIDIEISSKKNLVQEPPFTHRTTERPPIRKIIRPPQTTPQNQSEIKEVENCKTSINIATIPFESNLVIRLRHIYGVLYFMRQGDDFPSATKKTLKLFPEVQDYQTISDKCARGFADSVDNFVSWFNSGQMLNKLSSKFNLSSRDHKIFSQLLN